VRSTSSVSPVNRALDKAEVANISRNRGLRRLDAPRPQAVAQLFLARDCLTLDDLENRRLPV
jgi:hypothetical protein